MARLARLSALVVWCLVAARITLGEPSIGAGPSLSHIALAGTLPLQLSSQHRFALLSNPQWITLVLFAALSVLMASLWQSRFFQTGIERPQLDLTRTPAVMGSASC